MSSERTHELGGSSSAELARAATIDLDAEAARTAFKTDGDVGTEAEGGGRSPAPPGDDAAALPEGELPASSRALWVLATLAGGILTVAIFLFIGSLQPTLSGDERITLPETISIDLIGKKSQKPPPPVKPQREKSEPQKVERERPTRTQDLTTRTSVARVRRPMTQTETLMRPDVGAGLAGLGGLEIGMAVGSGAGIQLPRGDAMLLQQYSEMKQRQERRERVREVSRFGGIGALADLAGASGFSEPSLIFKQDPRYPRKAEAEGQGGIVRFKLLVSMTGSVEDVEIIAAQPEGIFEDSIRDAVRMWQFEPAKDDNGDAMEFWKECQYVFRPSS